MRQIDKAMVNLLTLPTQSQVQLPSILPDGKYTAKSLTIINLLR